MSNIHALSDVSEIARLRRENAALRRAVARAACYLKAFRRAARYLRSFSTCDPPGTCTGCQAIAAQAAQEDEG